MKRGYKETEIGEIPVEWEVKELNQITIRINEQAGSRKIEPMSISAGIGFVSQREKWGKDISGKQYVKYTVLRRGQFAYNKGNSLQFPQGCIYLVEDTDIITVPNVFICFAFDSHICENHYYKQLFISNFHGKSLKKYIKSGTRNNGLLNLNSSDFFSIPVFLPPLPEQKRIAEILSSVDEAIRATKAVIDQTKALKQGLLHQLLTKGIGHKKFKQTEIGEIPVEWEVKELGELAKFTSGKTKPLNLVVKIDETHKYPVFGGNNIMGYSCEYLINEETLIIGRVGEYCGVVYLSPSYCWITDNALYVVEKKEKYENLFIFYLLVWKNISQYRNKGGQPLISQSILNPLQIPIPTLPEQKKIAKILSSVDETIRENANNLEQLKATKSGLMQDLLTGKKRVQYAQP